MSKIVGPISIFGIKYDGTIEKGVNLPKLVVEIARKSKFKLIDGDIVILTHTVVAKAEGLIFNLNNVKPSPFAEAVARKLDKDPRVVQIILNETKNIVRLERKNLITESKAGIISANAGVDLSNVDGGNSAVIVPRNPDKVAKKYAEEFKKFGLDVAVIITDTLGRPFRLGDVNFAIGSYGITPLRDLRGKKDLFGRVLRIKRIAIIDELAASAELITGSSNEGIIGAVVRGYKYEKSKKGARSIQRPPERDFFK